VSVVFVLSFIIVTVVGNNPTLTGPLEKDQASRPASAYGGLRASS
jgi:hypothetical protein